MAIRNKIDSEWGYTYFITFTILDWIRIFTSDKYFDLVYKWFNYIRDKYDNKIYAYVIMPNHVHVLIYISKLSPIVSKLIQNAKRFLAYGIVDLLEQDNRQDILSIFKSKADTSKGAKHKIFEDRYDSKCVINRKFFQQKLDYIHKNPCQQNWKLVDIPENYKHSSAANYFLGQGFYDGIEIAVL